MKGTVNITPSTNSGITGFPYAGTFDISDTNLYKFNGETYYGAPENVYIAVITGIIGTSGNGVSAICMPYFSYESSSYNSDITKFNNRFAPKTWKVLCASNISLTITFALLVWI